jgi:pyruvate,water dikinase
MSRHREHPHALPRLALTVVLAWSLAPASARADTSLSVQPPRVSAGLFFDGTRLEVRGTAGEFSQLVVRVIGPPDRQIYNRRGKIGGLIWGGVEHVTFRHAPSVYALYTSAALSSVADAAERSRLMLGYEGLAEQVSVEGTKMDRTTVVGYLLHLKEREGLYRVRPGAVQLEDVRSGSRGFEVTVELPPTVPPGVFEVTLFEFTHGALTSTRTTKVTLERVGLPASLFRLAHEHGIAFGLLAVMVSLATGLGTGLAAGRKRVRRGRTAAGPGEAAAPPEHGPETARVLSIVLRTVREAMSSHPFGPGRVEAIEDLRATYRVFRDLLSVNNEVLALLAELEEESSWTSFRQPRVRMEIRALFDGTADMVRLLNQLTDDRYFDLANVVSSIRHDVMEFLAKMEAQDDPRLTLQLKEITSATASRVGGKAVNLARLECDLGVRVPESFVVTTEAYREFLENEGLGSELRTVLAPARLDAPDDFRRRCELAQSLIDQAAVPPAVLDAIDRAWASSGIPPTEGAAVRSSASGEDSELSFAGQFETVLNVPRSAVGDGWKRVVRSRFAPRAVFYRRAAGLAEVDTPMAVLVQRMVRSRASGVLFTRRPDDPKAPVLLITSVLGLGPEVSAGIANADEVVVSGRAPRHILERRIARKAERLVSAGAGGLARETVDPEDQIRSAITDEEALALADRALAVEHYFGHPQDIEWAIDTTGEIFLLQSRPLRTERGEATGPEVPLDAPLLLRGGQPVWPGRAVGPVYVAKTQEDEERIPAAAILVVPQLLPDCVRFLPRICAVLVERGTVTGHAASIVREFRVPSLFGLEGAMEKLVPGQVVSVDVLSRSVFAGVLWPELRGHLPLTLVGRQTIGLPTVLASKLTKLSGSSFMSSWACQSLHDVIRFAHETAILAMFEVGDRLLDSRLSGVKKLVCPPPVYLHLLDLGGGLRPEAIQKRSVEIEDVVSLPFRALWRGLGDEAIDQGRLGIPEPRYFASVMTSTVTAEGGRPLGVPNYACITDSYLNLNSRQAYHFAIVDAFLGDNQNNNHISMRLKGGGAAPWQRTLRVEFMAEVLRLHHFTVNVTGDILNGWCRGIDKATGAQKLAMLGHLIRFSAQLDLWMTDQSQVKKYVAAFIQAETEAARLAYSGLTDAR